MALVQFMNSGMGRVARAVLGVLLILVGLALVGGVAGVIIAIIGLLPIAAGGLDFCVLAPLFGQPLRPSHS